MAEPYVYRGSTYRDNASLRTWLAGEVPEDVLEPALLIIDPHHHFWESPQRGRYLLHEFLADLAAGHNVVQTVFMECDAMYRASGPEEMKPDRHRRCRGRQDGTPRRHGADVYRL